MKKIVTSGMIGNALEWYDYALFGHFAVLISQLYFPTEDPLNSLMATFGVFAAGFAMRPLGAILFGWIGDRFSRKLSLSISILMMAIPTAFVGVLPTYAEIGILAPILLTVIRILQGLSIGGEFGGSIIYIVEHAPENKRGFAGSSSIFSLALGILAGSLIATIFSHSLSKEDFESWGWRVPFLLSFLIGIVGFYIRSHLSESPKFLEAKEKGEISKSPLFDMLKYHWRDTSLAIVLYLTVTVPFYTMSVFMTSYLVKYVGVEMSFALLVNSIAMFVMLIISPISGYFSDIIGRKKVLLFAAIGMLLSLYFIFETINSADHINIIFAMVIFSFFISCYMGPMPTVLVELFPTSVRFTSMSLAYNISAAIFGGTMPIIGFELLKISGDSNPIILYVAAYIAISIIALLFFYKDKYKEILR